MGMLLKISHLIDTLTRFVGRSIIWLILAATLISAANAIARKGLNIGSNAMLEIQWYLFAAVFMLGAGHAFLENAHVRIDVLANKLGKRARMYIDIGGILLFLLPMCYLISNFAWPVLSAAYVSGEVSSNAGGLIRWPLFALVPAGFALLALQGISELFKRIAYLAGAGPDPLAHEPDAHAAAPAVTQDTTENAPGEARK
ncbi:C4-dicarboxylate ABC transporter substrate-binding protein [Zoogloeaceae bacteirum Par-f-2]|nr:C4-dicarboxylate ABC transporter substrate-binding protein [Zoogloeaceae bacteirum Par-f-2]